MTDQELAALADKAGAKIYRCFDYERNGLIFRVRVKDLAQELFVGAELVETDDKMPASVNRMLGKVISDLMEATK